MLGTLTQLRILIVKFRQKDSYDRLNLGEISRKTIRTLIAINIDENRFRMLIRPRERDNN